MYASRRAAILSVLLVLVVVCAGCDWAQTEFGPQHTSFDPYEPALTDTSVAHMSQSWATTCTCTSPVVSGDRLYTVDSSNARFLLRALDTADGHVVWSARLPNKTSAAGVIAVANGLVYATAHVSDTVSDKLLTFDRSTGKRRWSFTPPAPGAGAVRMVVPIVDGRLAFLGGMVSSSNEAEVSAVDPAGHVVWSAIPGGAFFGTEPLAANPGKTVFAVTADTSPTSQGAQLLTGYDESTGNVHSAVAVQPSPGLPILTIAFANGRIFGTGDTGFGRAPGLGPFALDPDTGAVLWSVASVDLFEEAVSAHSVFTTNERVSSLTARDQITGAALWTRGNTNVNAVAVAGNIAFVGGTVFQGSAGTNEVLALRVSDGTPLANIPASPGESVAAVVPSSGQLYVVETSQLEAFTPR